MTSIGAFLLLCDRFCEAAGMAEATLASRMLFDGKRIAAIRGGSDIGSRRLDQAVAWLSANWPEGADWPDGVERPARLANEEARP